MMGDKYAQSFYGAWLVKHGKSFEAQAHGVAWLRKSLAQRGLEQRGVNESRFSKPGQFPLQSPGGE